MKNVEEPQFLQNDDELIKPRFNSPPLSLTFVGLLGGMVKEELHTIAS